MHHSVVSLSKVVVIDMRKQWFHYSEETSTGCILSIQLPHKDRLTLLLWYSVLANLISN